MNAAIKKTISNMDNLTDEALADVIGALDREIKEQQKELSRLKDEFVERDLSEAEGEKYKVQKLTMDRSAFNKALMIEAFGDEAYEKCLKTSKVTQVRINRID